MKYSIISLVAIVFLTIYSCGIPKEILQRIEKGKKNMTELPLNHCISLPTPTFEQWDQDYNLYNHFLTNEIMKTQLGLSFEHQGVQIWFCNPAVRIHAQLDTTTMINEKSSLIGDWRITCNRKILFKDSVVYAEKKIYRDTELIYDEKKEDVFVQISDTKFNLYGTENGNPKFTKSIHKKYSVKNKRFLMLYGATNTVLFIGIDKEGHLIINSCAVEERKIKGVYISYYSVVTQMIFSKQS